MTKFKNTLNRGAIRYIVFRSGGSWYAVGLEFNIVESGDTPREAMLLLFEALQGYLESARRIKARPSILNQKSASEYEKMWSTLQNAKQKKDYPASVYTFGSLNLSKSLGRALIPA